MGIETMIPAWICFVLGVSFLWVVHVVSMRRLKRWATVNEVFHSATYYGDTPGTATVIVRNARNYIMHGPVAFCNGLKSRIKCPKQIME